MCDISWNSHNPNTILSTWQALNKCLLMDSFLYLHPFGSSGFELSIGGKAMPCHSNGLIWTARPPGRYYLGRWAFCFPETPQGVSCTDVAMERKAILSDTFWKLWCICCIQPIRTQVVIESVLYSLGLKESWKYNSSCIPICFLLCSGTI